LIELSGYDLRDPKIGATGDGKRLMILGGAAVRERAKPATGSQSFVTFSREGKSWKALQWAGATNQRRWRVTWHKGKAYGICYAVSPVRRSAKRYGTSLLVSDDGVNFTTLLSPLYTNSGPAEATLRFAKDDTLRCLQPRDGKISNTALLGVSKPPYQDWQWKDLGKHFGGPNFIEIPDG
jgi:hypothetical protein